jgi:trans-AT polyketide synthase/acyltransferase/oxidoreductase domain-containing protein
MNKEVFVIHPENLGCSEFKKDYKIKYAYTTGSMYKGIASKEIVVSMGKAGLIGFLGAGGLPLEQLEKNIKYITEELGENKSFGMNLLCNLVDPDMEMRTIELYLKNNVRNIEASAFSTMTKSIVYFRLKGITRLPDGSIYTPNNIIAKLSRPEVAEAFLCPAPDNLVNELVAKNLLTVTEAELSKYVPVASDICVESDSGGHTDGRSPFALLPAIIIMRDSHLNKYKYAKRIRVGAAGGIGSPEAAAAAFIMGADFITTGSINQCTVESGTSTAVKDILQRLDIQDTTYAPAGDMFEIGARVQVVRKESLFAARANKLYDIYRAHNSIDEIDTKTKEMLEKRYFKRDFNSIWQDAQEYYQKYNPTALEEANQNPKRKMALIFRWYFGYSTRLAMNGELANKEDFQIHCGPAMGSFNQWVKGTELEDWRNRHVDLIAEKLMQSTAELFSKHLNKIVLNT